LHFNPYLEFGESTVWTRIDTIIFLSNQGSENTNIYSIYSSDPVFSADQIEFIIPAGDSGELTLSFIPDAGISYEAVIIIENSTGRDRPMFLTGTGVTLTFDDIIDFGPVLVGSPKDSTIVITNPTNEEILVSNVVSENPEFSVESTTFSVPPQSEYLLTLTFTPQNTGLTEGQLTLMSNAGNPSFNLTGIGLEPSSWKIQQSGVIDDLLDVHFADSLTAWIVGNAGTILKTIDAGLSWEAQSSGTTLSLRSVHFPDTNSGWAVGANGTILKTTDGGQEWIAESSGTNALLTSVYFISPSLGWVTGTNGVVLRTENGGQEWQTIASFGFNTITSVYFVTNDTGWVVGTYGFIRKTTNGGDVWDIQTSPSENHLWSVQFTNLSNGWIVGEKGELLKTDDGGTSWIEQAVVLTPDFAGLELISAESYWIVGDEGTILKSFNGGEVWIPQYSGTSSNLNSVSFGSKHNGVIVGTGGLILNTTNGGVVAIDGQHRPDIKGPYQYSLSQNYPNPFNPVTKINYVLPVTNYVNLSIFNLLGELLTTLVDEKQNAGYHQVEWDASGFASGVYYYRMDAGDYHDAKKMILLR
jgi:photosystem II stability/assembly factor-like uncharacterized protein